MPNNALIGFSGFVGSTLLRQTKFEHLYRSTNIAEIDGKRFDTVVCCGAQAQKWKANKDPEADWAGIAGLLEHLQTIQCRHFILISTVDVFQNPVDVDEDTVPAEAGLHAYGLNRLRLEQFVTTQFGETAIVRLPGLVGPGLRKNIIYDLHHHNNVDAIDSRAQFQFYPMVNLWADIQTALRHRIPLTHLTSAPVSVAAVASEGFGRAFTNELAGPLPRYDFQTKYANAFGGAGKYQYSERETMMAIRAYTQSEPRESKG